MRLRSKVAVAVVAAAAAMIVGGQLPSATAGTWSYYGWEQDVQKLAEVQIKGAAPNDEAGMSVASAGDFNGDGVDDVVLTAPFAADRAGKAYVVFGRRGTPTTVRTVDLAHLGTDGFEIDGPHPGAEVWTAKSVGDLDGDGNDDLVVGAVGARVAAGAPDPGYHLAPVVGSTPTDPMYPSASAALQGGVAFSFTAAQTSVGITPAVPQGVAYVVFGRPGAGVINLATDEALSRIVAPPVTTADGTWFGWAVAAAGNAGGAGRPAVAISDPLADRVYVVQLPASRGQTLSISQLGQSGGPEGFTISNVNSTTGSSLAGWSLDAGRDANGDGIDDIAIGAPDEGAPTYPQGEGAAYVVYGQSGSPQAVSLPQIKSGAAGGFRIGPETNTFYVGEAVALLPDTTGDGRPELAIGVPKWVSTIGTSVQTLGAYYVAYSDSFGSQSLSTVVASCDRWTYQPCHGYMSLGQARLGTTLAGTSGLQGAAGKGVLLESTPDTWWSDDVNLVYATQPISMWWGHLTKYVATPGHRYASLAGAGDNNADGDNDVVIGSPFSDLGAGTGSGSVHLYDPDVIAPTVSVSSPGDGAHYYRNQRVTASFTCSDEPGGSGLAGCWAGVVNTDTFDWRSAAINGDRLDTSRLGRFLFWVDAVDQQGNETEVQQSYSVDDRPPDCSHVGVSPATLSPPDGTLRNVSLTGASDPDGDQVSYQIASVTQDEAVGDTSPDAMRTSDPATLKLRSERDGTGDGRVYRVSFQVSDGHGMDCTGVALASVPHDSNQPGAIDSGGTFDSLAGG